MTDGERGLEPAPARFTPEYSRVPIVVPEPKEGSMKKIKLPEITTTSGIGLWILTIANALREAQSPDGHVNVLLTIGGFLAGLLGVRASQAPKK